MQFLCERGDGDIPRGREDSNCLQVEISPGAFIRARCGLGLERVCDTASDAGSNLSK